MVSMTNEQAQKYIRIMGTAGTGCLLAGSFGLGYLHGRNGEPMHPKEIDNTPEFLGTVAGAMASGALVGEVINGIKERSGQYPSGPTTVVFLLSGIIGGVSVGSPAARGLYALGYGLGSAEKAGLDMQMLYNQALPYMYQAGAAAENIGHLVERMF